MRPRRRLFFCFFFGIRLLSQPWSRHTTVGCTMSCTRQSCPFTQLLGDRDKQPLDDGDTERLCTRVPASHNDLE